MKLVVLLAELANFHIVVEIFRITHRVVPEFFADVFGTICIVFPVRVEGMAKPVTAQAGETNLLGDIAQELPDSVCHDVFTFNSTWKKVGTIGIAGVYIL